AAIDPAIERNEKNPSIESITRSDAVRGPFSIDPPSDCEWARRDAAEHHHGGVAFACERADLPGVRPLPPERAADHVASHLTTESTVEAELQLRSAIPGNRLAAFDVHDDPSLPQLESFEVGALSRD